MTTEINLVVKWLSGKVVGELFYLRNVAGNVTTNEQPLTARNIM